MLTVSTRHSQKCCLGLLAYIFLDTYIRIEAYSLGHDRNIPRPR